MKQLPFLILFLLSSCSQFHNKQDEKTKLHVIKQDEKSKFYLFYYSAGAYDMMDTDIFNEVMGTNYDSTYDFRGYGIHNINDSLNIIIYKIFPPHQTEILVSVFSYNTLLAEVYFKDPFDMNMDFFYNGYDGIYKRKEVLPTVEFKLYKEGKTGMIPKAQRKYISSFDLKYDISTKKFIVDEKLKKYLKQQPPSGARLLNQNHHIRELHTGKQDKKSKFHLFYFSAIYDTVTADIFNEVMGTSYDSTYDFRGYGIHNINDSSDIIKYDIYSKINHQTEILVSVFSYNTLLAKVYFKVPAGMGMDFDYNDYYLYKKKETSPKFRVHLYKKGKTEKAKKYISSFDLKYDIATKKFYKEVV